MFLVDLVAAADPDHLAEVRGFCGGNGECVFDALVTNNDAIGKATLEKEMLLAEESDNLGRYPIMQCDETYRIWEVGF